MAVVTTYYLKTLTWNGNTWDSSAGGTLELNYEHDGEFLKGRTGDDEYPTFGAVVDKNCRVTVRLRDVIQSAALGAASSNIVATLKAKATTPSITFANMNLVAVRGAQGRATLGDVTMVFEHLSSNGSTNPVS
jgi:hypothetical protein